MNVPIDTPVNSRTYRKGLTEIYFGEKGDTINILDGVWNVGYRYRDKLTFFPFWPCLRITHENKKILEIDIRFTPNYYIRQSPGIQLESRPHDWINPYFWIKQGLYPPTKYKRIDEVFIRSKGTTYHPFDEDFEIIFTDIWKICLAHEGQITIPQNDFLNLIWMLRYLIQNTLVFPIEQLNLEEWKWFGRQYLEEAHNIFPESLVDEKHLSGWLINDDGPIPKNVKTIFLSDMRCLLNLILDTYKNDSGIEIFIRNIVYSFAEELKNRQISKICSLCKRLMFYSQSKQYCSLKTDGKECGKKARNKRHYQKHREKIIPKATIKNKELKDFYKKKGVKK